MLLELFAKVLSELPKHCLHDACLVVRAAQAIIPDPDNSR